MDGALGVVKAEWLSTFLLPPPPPLRIYPSACYFGLVGVSQEDTVMTETWKVKAAFTTWSMGLLNGLIGC